MRVGTLAYLSLAIGLIISLVQIEPVVVNVVTEWPFISGVIIVLFTTGFFIVFLHSGEKLYSSNQHEPVISGNINHVKDSIAHCQNREVPVTNLPFALKVLGRIPAELADKVFLRLPRHTVLSLYTMINLNSLPLDRRIHAMLASSRIRKIRSAVDTLDRFYNEPTTTAEVDDFHSSRRCLDEFAYKKQIKVIAHLHLEVVFKDLLEKESMKVESRDADGSVTLFVRVANRRQEWRGRNSAHAVVDGDMKSPFFCYRGVQAFFYEEKTNRLYYLTGSADVNFYVYYKTPGSDDPAQFVFSEPFGCSFWPFLSVDEDHVIVLSSRCYWYYNKTQIRRHKWISDARGMIHHGNGLIIDDKFKITMYLLAYPKYLIRTRNTIKLNNQTYVYITDNERPTVQLAYIHKNKIKIKTLGIPVGDCSDRLARIADHMFVLTNWGVRRVFVCEIFDDELLCEEIGISKQPLVYTHSNE